MKPRLLDLFCGAGGAAMGYHRAGFEVVGVDIAPQPTYPFRFIEADAIDYIGGAVDLSPPRFDAIHASPPCQGYTTMNQRWENTNPRLIAETRDLLIATGLPYVIENVPGAASALENPIQLCGRSLGLTIHRHRLFETNFPLMSQPCTGGSDAFGIYGKLDGRRLWTRADGSTYRAARTLEEAQEAMGMPWADWHGVKEAIPPIYTTHIGEFLLNHLASTPREAAA